MSHNRGISISQAVHRIINVMKQLRHQILPNVQLGWWKFCTKWYPNSTWLFHVTFQLNITWKPMAETASYNSVTRRFRGDSFFITSHRKSCHVADTVNETLVLAFLILFVCVLKFILPSITAYRNKNASTFVLYFTIVM